MITVTPEFGDINNVLLGMPLVVRVNGNHRPPPPSSIGTYRFCHPDNLAIIKNGKIVYEWIRDGETRRELFFDELKRTYEGDQFCFCEYGDIADRLKRFPTREDISKKAKERGISELDTATEEMYAEFLRKIVQLAENNVSSAVP